MFLVHPGEIPPSLLAASTLRDLRPGEMLCHRGEPTKAVSVVVHGRLELSSCTCEGKRIPLYVVRSGECVSEAALFNDMSCADVIAEVQSRLHQFPKEALMRTLREHPALAAEYMTLQAKRFNLIWTTVELRAVRSARERVLQYLRTSQYPCPYTVRIDRPLKYVADELSLSHESFYRTLRQLTKEGIVVRTKGRLSLEERTLERTDERLLASSLR